MYQNYATWLGVIESEWTMSIAEAAALSCSCKVVGASHGGNPWSRWWTPEVKVTIGLKKESYWAWLPCGTLQAANRYRQAKGNTAQAVAKAITQVWKELGEVIKKYFWTALNRFWQTVRQLRRRKRCSTCTVYSAGGMLLTSTEDTVGWWKEYFNSGTR